MRRQIPPLNCINPKDTHLNLATGDLSIVDLCNACRVSLRIALAMPLLSML